MMLGFKMQKNKLFTLSMMAGFLSLMLSFSTVSYAATKQDCINAVKASKAEVNVKYASINSKIGRCRVLIVSKKAFILTEFKVLHRCAIISGTVKQLKTLVLYQPNNQLVDFEYKITGPAALSKNYHYCSSADKAWKR